MGTIFVTNRPNYCHRRFAESIKARFFYIKHYFPDGVPVFSLPINGWLNSFSLPESEIYFSESILDYYPVYYKNPKGKKIILIAEDTLFKLKSMQKMKKNFILKIFRSADGFIAISDLCKELLEKYIDKPCRVAYPFPHKDFSHIKADTKSKNIIFIGRKDPTKGYHNLIEAVKLLRKENKEWNLYLVGRCSEGIRKEDGIHPLGEIKNIDPYIKKCSLLVHPAYFDSCPATVFEAMQAGVIPIISNNIGQTKIFRENNLKELILEVNEPNQIAKKMIQIHGKTKIMSKKIKKVVFSYNEKKRISLFRKEFNLLVKEIDEI
jgi:glycosyltransferase involved in cell wall biosynthesis